MGALVLLILISSKREKVSTGARKVIEGEILCSHEGGNHASHWAFKSHKRLVFAVCSWRKGKGF